jgi:two-component system cell cycle response regulator
MGLDSCILVSARFSDSSRIVSCLKTGAYDAILQPLNEEWAAITITRAFERRRYYDQARYTDRSWQLYVFDELTRVHKHRYFHLALEKAIRAAQRYRYAVSLLLIDIDNFKAYNDRHGHIAGDEVLRTLGSFLARSIRASDIVARYGGEEFTVILPHTKKGGAMALAERIREGVAAMQFSTRGPVPSDRLTVSAGVASFPADARTKDELVSKTGLALAKAKRRGRNRVGVC